MHYALPIQTHYIVLLCCCCGPSTVPIILVHKRDFSDCKMYVRSALKIVTKSCHKKKCFPFSQNNDLFLSRGCWMLALGFYFIRIWISFMYKHLNCTFHIFIYHYPLLPFVLIEPFAP